VALVKCIKKEKKKMALDDRFLIGFMALISHILWLERGKFFDKYLKKLKKVYIFIAILFAMMSIIMWMLTIACAFGLKHSNT